jgi:GNAT superfamily N-acetyltransferase
VVIRSPESAEELFAVAPLFDAYRVFYNAASDPAGARNFLYDRWRLRESVLFIAYDGAEPQGFVQLYPIFASGEMRRLWLLNDLFVADAARRSGIGRALMRRAEQHARETGAVGLTLSTALDNARAKRLYESELYERDSVFCVYNRML